MRILLETHHPAHVHFFKYPVRIWQDRGHQVLIAGRKRGIMEELFQAFSWMPVRVISEAGRKNKFPFREFITRQCAMHALIREFKPDVVASVMGSYAQMAHFSGVANLVFTDSEHQSFNHGIAHPFATRVYTPDCFWKNLGGKQVRYNGYHELSFLNPRHFQPNEEILTRLGADRGTYVIVRLSAWNTYHDAGSRGIENLLEKIVGEIAKKYRVLLVPEGEVPEDMKKHVFPLQPHELHDALAFAAFVVSEGASTASEAACLGVPAIYINPLQLGYLAEQEKDYGLVRNFKNPEGLLDAVRERMESTDAEVFTAARSRLLADKIDVTQFIANEIENHALSA